MTTYTKTQQEIANLADWIRGAESKTDAEWIARHKLLSSEARKEILRLFGKIK